MKKTWVVYISHSAGHELNNCITEAEWYGPYTQKQAEKLADDLNHNFHAADSDQERLEAVAMPLAQLSPRRLVAHYYDTLFNDET